MRQPTRSPCILCIFRFFRFFSRVSRLRRSGKHFAKRRRSTCPPFTTAGPIRERVGSFESPFKSLSNAPSRIQIRSQTTEICLKQCTWCYYYIPPTSYPSNVPIAQSEYLLLSFFDVAGSIPRRWGLLMIHQMNDGCIFQGALTGCILSIGMHPIRMHPRY